MTNVRKGGLAIVFIVCFVALLINLGGAYSKEADSPLPKLENVVTVEQQSQSLAEEIVGSNNNVQERFADEVLDIYYRAKDKDLVIYFCEGGWGSRPLSVNPEGQSLVAGIESELAQLGYTYCTADYPRSRYTLGDYLYEGKELLMRYPVKSKQLAAKLNFLTQQIDDLEVILVGKSTGALFVEETAQKLADNPDIYTIQLANPLGYRIPVQGRSLAICDNGIADDAMLGLDLWAAFKANGIKMILINCVPSFTPVDWLLDRILATIGLCTTRFALEIPGHEYKWHYPGVGSVIETFLVEKFGCE